MFPGPELSVFRSGVWGLGCRGKNATISGRKSACAHHQCFAQRAPTRDLRTPPHRWRRDLPLARTSSCARTVNREWLCTEPFPGASRGIEQGASNYEAGATALKREAPSFLANGEQLTPVLGLLHESQGQNLTVSGAFVPHALDNCPSSFLLYYSHA